MSYSFEMAFTECNKEDVLEKCQEIIRSIMNDVKFYLSKNIYYMPSNRYAMEDRISYHFDNVWLYKIFTFSFVYWEKYNLLSLVGYDYIFPDKTNGMFDMRFTFQNSTDQDYDYSEWFGINCFEHEVAKVKSKSDEEIIKICGIELDDWDNKSDAIEYHKKTLIYDNIYKLLDLDNWLYGRTGDFQRITLNGIETEEKYYELSGILRKIKKEEGIG